MAMVTGALRFCAVRGATTVATDDPACVSGAVRELAREMGWHDVPMLCVSEMDVPGAPRHCVRVLLHLAVPDERRVRPIYLHGACVLRPDLAASG